MAVHEIRDRDMGVQQDSSGNLPVRLPSIKTGRDSLMVHGSCAYRMEMALQPTLIARHAKQYA
jgi:hypothetical protein